MKILVVDDEIVIRDLFKQVLTYKGHHVEIATDGFEAVKRVKDEDFDMIFMDVIMKTMDGVEALKEIKKIKSEIPVVMMTGFALEDKIQEAIQLGAENFLYKPFNITEIFETVEKYGDAKPDSA